MRETWERDICNSNAIFDLVPLFLSPTLVSSSVHVHPFIRSAVCTTNDERFSRDCYGRVAAPRRLSASWLWNARRRTKIRLLASRSSNAKDDGRPVRKPNSLGTVATIDKFVDRTDSVQTAPTLYIRVLPDDISSRRKQQYHLTEVLPRWKLDTGRIYVCRYLS